MKLLKSLFLSLLIICNGQNVTGQVAQSVDDTAERERRRAQRQLDTRNKLNGYDNKGFIANRDMSPLPPALYNGVEKDRKRLRETYKRTRNMLVVPGTYYEKYKDLLNEKNVFLARLQPDKNCYGKYVVSIEEIERCSDVMPISGGGSLYSFRLRSNYPLTAYVMRIEDNITLTGKKPALGFDKEVDWWNIRFVNDKFIVQNSSMRGIISELGDVDLKDINPTSKELEFLNNFKQKNTLEEVKEQSEALKNGISFNNFVYFNTSPVKLNSTYVLRSIDYSSVRQMQLMRQFQPKKSYKLVDKRADLTIALKVVGREEDGSIIIIWKELKVGLLPS